MHISRITNCDTQEVRSEVSVSDYNKPNLGPLFYKKSTVDLAKQLLGKTLVRVMNDGTLVSGTIVETEAYLGVADRSCHCFGGRKTPKTEAMFMSPGTAYVYNIYFHYCCFNMSSDGKLKFLLHTYSFCDPLSIDNKLTEYPDESITCTCTELVVIIKIPKVLDYVLFKPTPRYSFIEHNSGTNPDTTVLYFFPDEGAVVLVRALEPIQGLDTMRKLRGFHRSDQGIKLKENQLCNGPSKLCVALNICKELFNKTDLPTSDNLYLANGRCIRDSQIVVSTRIGLDKQTPEWRLKPWRFYILGCPSVSVRDKIAEKLLVSANSTDCDNVLED